MKKKRVLKGWFKKLLFTGLLVIITISIYQLFTLKTVEHTPVGDYECSGGIFKICSGSQEVANYLGA